MPDLNHRRMTDARPYSAFVRRIKGITPDCCETFSTDLATVRSFCFRRHFAVFKQQQSRNTADAIFSAVPSLVNVRLATQ